MTVGGVAELIGVSKAFVLRHNRIDSLKSRVVGVFHKRFREERETFWALRNVSLSIARGEALGVIGRNGSGKTTLLRLLAGIFVPSAGQVVLEDNLRIGTMIELGVGFHQDLTGRENVYLSGSIHGLQKEEIDRIYPHVVEFAELQGFMDVPLKTYSSGMHMRLGFALAAHLNPGLLLIDEVLAVGDATFQHRCIRRMQEFKQTGTTIVLVSHNLDLIRSLCDRACLLDRGRVLAIGDPHPLVQTYLALCSGIDGQHVVPTQTPSQPISARPHQPPNAFGNEISFPTEIPSKARRSETKGAEILGVVLLDPEGRRVEGLHWDQVVIVRVSARYHTPLLQPIIGITLRDRFGIDVLVTNTTREGTHLPAVAAGEIHAVDFIFKLPSLAPGHYSISPAIADGDLIHNVMCARIDNAIGFDIEAPLELCGTLTVPITVRWRGLHSQD